MKKKGFIIIKMESKKEKKKKELTRFIQFKISEMIFRVDGISERIGAGGVFRIGGGTLVKAAFGTLPDFLSDMAISEVFHRNVRDRIVAVGVAEGGNFEGHELRRELRIADARTAVVPKREGIAIRF